MAARRCRSGRWHGQDRVEEIARMLAGVLTESTLDHARELLALAETTKTAS